MSQLPPAPAPSPSGATLDAAEVDRFAALASEWWDPKGKFRPLHRLGPARLAFVRREIVRHFGLALADRKLLKGLRILDIGSGGGLISEPLARLGAEVVGIDPAPENVAAARAHAATQGLKIDYRAATVEDLAAEKALFDVAVCLEVVEHVPDPGKFIAACAALVRPDGLLILSTINRTLKAYALAIVGAEYLMGWLPRGTHQWERFVTPDELANHLGAAGCTAPALEGLVYDPFGDQWTAGADLSVNYMAAAAKPAVR